MVRQLIIVLSLSILFVGSSHAVISELARQGESAIQGLADIKLAPLRYLDAVIGTNPGGLGFHGGAGGTVSAAAALQADLAANLLAGGGLGLPGISVTRIPGGGVIIKGPGPYGLDPFGPLNPLGIPGWPYPIGWPGPPQTRPPQRWPGGPFSPPFAPNLPGGLPPGPPYPGHPHPGHPHPHPGHPHPGHPHPGHPHHHGPGGHGPPGRPGAPGRPGGLHIPGLPGLYLPGILGLPGIQLPGLPSIDIPGLPSINLPGLPSINFPGLPSINPPGRPSMNPPGRPSINLPGLPSINLPGLPPNPGLGGLFGHGGILGTGLFGQRGIFGTGILPKWILDPLGIFTPIENFFGGLGNLFGITTSGHLGIQRVPHPIYGSRFPFVDRNLQGSLSVDLEGSLPTPLTVLKRMIANSFAWLG